MDTELLIKITISYGSEGFVKKIFDSTNQLTRNSLSLNQLLHKQKNIINLKISFFENKIDNVDIESMIEESILINEKRIHFLLKNNQNIEDTFSFDFLNALLDIIKKINKIEKVKFSNFFNEHIINVILEISKKIITNTFAQKNNNRLDSHIASNAINNIKLVIDFLNHLGRKKELNFFNNLLEKQISTSYSDLVKMLTSGYVLYNPIEKRFENEHIYYLNDEDDVGVIIDNYNYLSNDKKYYLNQICPIPIIKKGDSIEFDDYESKDCEKKFDMGCLLIQMEQYDNGIKLLNQIPDSFNKIKSIAHYYAVKLLIDKGKYTLANQIHNRILYPYFIAMSLFEFYKYYISIGDEKKAQNNYNKCLKVAESLKLNFEKSDLYYELYKDLTQHGEFQKAKSLKSNIDEFCYKLCTDIFDCELLFNSGEKRKSISLFKKISIDLNNISEDFLSENIFDFDFIEYGSKLTVKYNNLKRLLNNKPKPAIIFTDQNGDEVFKVNPNIKTAPKNYLNFFKQCTFDWMPLDGCGLWRDELKRLSKLGQAEKIRCMAESIKFEKFNTDDNGLYNARLIQADIYVQLGEYKKASYCLPAI